MGIVIVGIDLGKNVCSVVGLDGSGRVVLRRRMRREAIERFVECGAHHLGRAFGTQGHEVRLMSPEYVYRFRFDRTGVRFGCRSPSL